MTRATATVQEAIDEIGYGRFQRRLPAVCGVTCAADAAEPRAPLEDALVPVAR